MHNIFAVDLGGTKCSAAVIDRNGRILSRRTEPVNTASPSAPILQISELASALAGNKKVRDAFATCGIAVPGLVRPNGTVWAPNLPGWERMPLASRLRRLLGIPIIVESDRNAAVLGECWRGAARGKSDVIVLIVGTGIGAGILSGGRIVRGAHELSGCAGWLAVSGQDLPQSSRVGELESLAAGPAIAAAAKSLLDKGHKSSLSEFNCDAITATEVAAAARGGDALSLEVLHTAGRWLGFGIANLVSLFDPEIVVLGGGLVGAADLFSGVLRQAMFERAQPIAAKKVRLAISNLGDSANLLGCARLAWQFTSRQKSHRVQRKYRNSRSRIAGNRGGDGAM